MLAGRETELDRIDALLEAARSGDGGSLLLIGEAGIGKTALLAAARERAGEMRVAHAAGVESETRFPFAALSEVTRPFVDRLDELPGRQAAALGAALALRPNPAGPPDRLATLAGSLELLRLAASDRPLLILLDDVHWLDSPSADCLAYAARRLARSPIALLAAARAGEPHPTLDGRIENELPVTGLDRDAALEILRQSDSEIAAPVAEALVELAVGNPLALIELPPLLSDDQRRGRAPLDPVPAPGRVLGDAFTRRLATLPADSRDALLLLGASSDHELGPVLAACRARGIQGTALEEAETARLVELGDDRFAFAHPLLRAVVIDEASPAERRRAHGALAEHTTGDSRAWHLAEAAVGPDADVADALEQAAVRAMTRGGLSAAADAYERAATLSEGAAARAHRLYAAGVAAGLGGAYERAASLLEPAAEIDDPVQRAGLRHLLAMVTLAGGSRSALTNHELLTEEAARIEGIDPSLAATIHSDAGLFAAVGGECMLALAASERAIEVLPPNAPAATRCQVLSMLGMGRALAGHAAEAREALDAAGALLEEVNPLTPAGGSIGFALGGRISTGQDAELRAELRTLIGPARETGARGLLPYDQRLAAHVAFRLGDWDAAERQADEAVAIADDAGQRGVLPIALVVRARIHAARGEEEPARNLAGRAVGLAENSGYGLTIIAARGALGFLELGLGRPVEAIPELETTAELAKRAGLEDPLVVPWAPDLIEAYARIGRDEDAERLTGELELKAHRGGTALAEALAERCRGLLEDSFDERFERAIDLHGEADLPFELARTLLAFGSRLHRDRRRADARDRLREAAAIFAKLGARPWVEQTEAELRAAGAIKRAPVADRDELTAQEARVARAVARGATNREVAAEFFLSPKTIEFHLGQVYRKLGIRSRTQLASIVAAGGLEGGEVRGSDPNIGTRGPNAAQ